MMITDKLHFNRIDIGQKSKSDNERFLRDFKTGVTLGAFQQAGKTAAGLLL